MSETLYMRISTQKIWDFFFFFLFLSLSFLSFFLSLYRLVRFMAFQSVLVGMAPAFTIVIKSNKTFRPIYRYSLIRSHCALQHSPTFSTLIEKNIKDNVLKKKIYIYINPSGKLKLSFDRTTKNISQ